MIKTFLITAGSILVLDFVWLGLIVKGFNLRQLAPIGRIENGAFDMLIWPVVICYLMMPISMMLFSIPKSAAATSHLEAWLWGAALGFVIYGIYDFTNLAIIKNYPLKFALVDITWGTFLYGTVSWFVGYKLSR